MKVCLITGEFPPMQGGMGDFSNEVGKALIELGVETSVITSTQAQGPRDNRYDPALTVHPVVSRWGWTSWRPILDLARRERFDVLNVQYQAAAYGMHPAINFLPLRLRLWKERPKIVVTFHDLKVPYLFPKAGPLRWWAVMALVRWSEAAIVTNRQDLLTLQATCSNDLSRYYLIPIGSNIEPTPPPDYDRDQQRARWGVGPHGILLSYFGFLNESKGGEALIRALERLARDGHDVRLLMVGGQSGSSDPTNVAYAHYIKTLIEELGLAERVLWTGFTTPEQVSANLLASDICVLPYRDGASFRRGSFMAALVHGLPIVSTRPQVPLPELADGQNIALAPPDDVEALAAKIAALAASPERRARLGAGAAELSKLFRWDSIARKTLEVYRELVAGT